MLSLKTKNIYYIKIVSFSCSSIFFVCVKQPCNINEIFADLLTAAHVFLRRYTALDCRAERMALKEEKFFSSLHSCTDTIRLLDLFVSFLCPHFVCRWKLLVNLKIFYDTNLCNSDPPLDDACSVTWAGAQDARWARSRGGVQEVRGQRRWQARRGSGREVRGCAEEWGDDTVGDSVKLGDGGADRWCKVSVFFFVTLGPDTAQAVERLHFDKQVLGEINVARQEKINEKKTPPTINRETQNFNFL